MEWKEKVAGGRRRGQERRGGSGRQKERQKERRKKERKGKERKGKERNKNSFICPTNCVCHSSQSTVILQQTIIVKKSTIL